jgi:hypothetical protein
MMYNLSQVNINRYLEEQKIIAATQYPEYVGVPSAGLTAIQGGLQGISMGLDVYSGLRQVFGGPGGNTGGATTIQSGAFGGTLGPAFGNGSQSGAWGVPSSPSFAGRST